jgi:hypothetical protein
VELLRWQTIRPYIIVIDTGSTDETCDVLEKTRAYDLEVHYIRAHGWRQSSDPVAAAMDLAMAICRSEYLFCTHTDVFPRRQDLIENLQRIARENDSAAVGYEMSDRSHVTKQWRGMISHTATLLHMPTMRRIGAWWSMDRAREMLGTRNDAAGWPDTETCLNLILRQHGIRPYLIGSEANDERHVDHNIDHARSYTSAMLYATGDSKTNRKQWIESALAEAKERLDAWRTRADTVTV